MDTRKDDFESLGKSREKAKNAFERNLVDRTVGKIMRENSQVRSTREKLVMAVRNDDRQAVNRFQFDLMRMRQEETKGKDY